MGGYEKKMTEALFLPLLFIGNQILTCVQLKPEEQLRSSSSEISGNSEY